MLADRDGRARTPAAVPEMLQLIAGGWISRTIHVAIKLNLPDLLQHEPKSSAELAHATKTHAPSLHRLLRTLAAIGVIEEDDEGLFRLCPLGATLCTDQPGSLRPWAEFALGEVVCGSWDALLHSIRSGEVAFDHVYGVDVWEHRSRNQEHALLFDAAMASSGAAAVRAVLASYSFQDVSTVVDVGGGDGSLLIALLEQYPRLRGILVDVPHVVEKATTRLARSGVSSRCEVVAGDAFDCLPDGTDIYVLSRVVHDWNDTEAIRLLTTCHRAMTKVSRLLLIERVLPVRAARSNAAMMLFASDLHMMVMNGGRERTEGEFASLLKAAGLQLNNVISTGSPMSLIECARLDSTVKGAVESTGQTPPPTAR
jgi:hypothetical protein